MVKINIDLKILRFLAIQSGYKDEDGYGDGYGYGSGSGSGVSMHNNHKIYSIDSIQTAIISLKTNYARGFILNRDLTTSECYVAKCGNFFAHGTTLKQAHLDALAKYQNNLPIEERIELFVNEFNTSDKYSADVFYRWHNILTGSCLFGRDSFMEENDISKDDMFTVEEFINLTKNAYEGHIIKQLALKLGIE